MGDFRYPASNSERRQHISFKTLIHPEYHYLYQKWKPISRVSERYGLQILSAIYHYHGGNGAFPKELASRLQDDIGKREGSRMKRKMINTYRELGLHDRYGRRHLEKSQSAFWEKNFSDLQGAEDLFISKCVKYVDQWISYRQETIFEEVILVFLAKLNRIIRKDREDFEEKNPLREVEVHYINTNTNVVLREMENIFGYLSLSPWCSVIPLHSEVTYGMTPKHHQFLRYTFARPLGEGGEPSTEGKAPYLHTRASSMDSYPARLGFNPSQSLATPRSLVDAFSLKTVESLCGGLVIHLTQNEEKWHAERAREFAEEDTEDCEENTEQELIPEEEREDEDGTQDFNLPKLRNRPEGEGGAPTSSTPLGSWSLRRRPGGHLAYSEQQSIFEFTEKQQKQMMLADNISSTPLSVFATPRSKSTNSKYNSLSKSGSVSVTHRALAGGVSSPEKRKFSPVRSSLIRENKTPRKKKKPRSSRVTRAASGIS